MNEEEEAVFILEEQILQIQDRFTAERTELSKTISELKDQLSVLQEENQALRRALNEAEILESVLRTRFEDQGFRDVDDEDAEIEEVDPEEVDLDEVILAAFFDRGQVLDAAGDTGDSEEVCQCPFCRRQRGEISDNFYVIISMA